MCVSSNRFISWTSLLSIGRSGSEYYSKCGQFLFTLDPPEPEEVEVDPEIEIERPDVVMDESEVTVEDVVVDAPAADVVMPNLLSVKKDTKRPKFVIMKNTRLNNKKEGK